MRHVGTSLTIILIALGSASLADAGTSTADLGVSATVINNCAIVASSSVAFGAYDPLAGSPLDATGALTVACTAGSSATIMLGQGVYHTLGSTDAAPARQMSYGTSMLAYELYSDSPGGTVWGNTLATGLLYDSTSSVAQNVTVFGRIPSGQGVPAGDYSDTVVATISF